MFELVQKSFEVWKHNVLNERCDKAHVRIFAPRNEDFWQLGDRRSDLRDRKT